LRSSLSIGKHAQLTKAKEQRMKHVQILASTGLLCASICLAQAPATIPGISEQQEPTEAGQLSPLSELDWMTGTWVDQGEDATITTNCSWTHNRKFLSRSFKVVIEGEQTLEGTQVVGWDPIGAQIRSWTFDSEGGFGEGRWTRDGDRWLVKTSFVLPSGERASAINVFTFVDKNTLKWQSTNREIAGELQPNIPQVTVVRQQTDPTQNDEADSQ
jgi:hypothetical protein